MLTAIDDHPMHDHDEDGGCGGDYGDHGDHGDHGDQDDDHGDHDDGGDENHMVLKCKRTLIISCARKGQFRAFSCVMQLWKRTDTRFSLIRHRFPFLSRLKLP